MNAIRRHLADIINTHPKLESDDEDALYTDVMEFLRTLATEARPWIPQISEENAAAVARVHSLPLFLLEFGPFVVKACQTGLRLFKERNKKEAAPPPPPPILVVMELMLVFDTLIKPKMVAEFEQKAKEFCA